MTSNAFRKRIICSAQCRETGGEIYNIIEYSVHMKQYLITRKTKTEGKMYEEVERLCIIMHANIHIAVNTLVHSHTRSLISSCFILFGLFLTPVRLKGSGMKYYKKMLWLMSNIESKSSILSVLGIVLMPFICGNYDDNSVSACLSYHFDLVRKSKKLYALVY